MDYSGDLSADRRPQPVRLRATTDSSIGTTAFFRNRVLLEVLCDRLAQLPGRRIKVLIHAGSIGAEAWSLAIATALDDRLKTRQVEISVTDREQQFLEFARSGRYPREILNGLTAREQQFFKQEPDGAVRVCDELRSRVCFLPASSVGSFNSSDCFDVVQLLNVLLYMPAEQQSRVIDQVSGYNRHLLITTGFHFDRIKQDMRRNGYHPINTQAHAIHDAWVDRRCDVSGNDEVIPGKIFHPWSLPPFTEVADYEYKYCALFEKRNSGE